LSAARRSSAQVRTTLLLSRLTIGSGWPSSGVRAPVSEADDAVSYAPPSPPLWIELLLRQKEKYNSVFELLLKIAAFVLCRVYRGISLELLSGLSSLSLLRTILILMHLFLHNSDLPSRYALNTT
jgi:hypothetical protein